MFHLLFDVSFPCVNFSVELTSRCLHILSWISRLLAGLVSILVFLLLSQNLSLSDLYLLSEKEWVFTISM